MKANAEMIELALEKCKLNCFSREGIEAILEYYDAFDKDKVFVPKEFHDEWAEYGGNCALDWSDFMDDFGYLVDKDWFDIDDVLDAFEDGTYMIADNGNVITRKD